jgi:hypothetical protein
MIKTRRQGTKKKEKAKGRTKCNKKQQKNHCSIRGATDYGVTLHKPHPKLEAHVFPVADVAAVLPDLPQALRGDGRDWPRAKEACIHHTQGLPLTVGVEHPVRHLEERTAVGTVADHCVYRYRPPGWVCPVEERCGIQQKRI